MDGTSDGFEMRRVERFVVDDECDGSSDVDYGLRRGGPVRHTALGSEDGREERRRPLEAEIQTLRVGIAKLGEMLEDGSVDPRDVALPLARLVRSLAVALRTEHTLVGQEEDPVQAAMRRVLIEHGRRLGIAEHSQHEKSGRTR